MAIPDAVNYKIVRSITHLQELQVQLERYLHTNPAQLIGEQQSNSDDIVGVIRSKDPIPAILPIIIGDCLQNLRSSLDYLVWELVLAAKNKPGINNAFPICSSVEAFDDQLTRRRRLEGVCPDAIDEIRELQPYHCGADFAKSLLWIIDSLCNVNKHRRVLLTHLHGQLAPDDFQTKMVNGKLWGLLDISAMRNPKSIGQVAMMDAPPGPAAQVNRSVIVFVSFNEGSASNMEVGLVMNELIKFMSKSVLPKFERFF